MAHRRFDHGEVFRLSAEGVHPRDIAERVGTSKTNVYRILRSASEGRPNGGTTVPAELVLKHVRDYVNADTSRNRAVNRLVLKTGIDKRRIWLMVGDFPNEFLTFDQADTMLCAIDKPELWLEAPLVDYYMNLNLLAIDIADPTCPEAEREVHDFIRAEHEGGLSKTTMTERYGVGKDRLRKILAAA